MVVDSAATALPQTLPDWLAEHAGGFGDHQARCAVHGLAILAAPHDKGPAPLVPPPKLHGLYYSHPLLCLLSSIGGRRPSFQQHVLANAVVEAAHIRQGKGQAPTGQAVYVAALAVRKLPTTVTLDLGDTDLASVHGALLAWLARPGNTNKQARRYVGDIAALLALALEVRPPREGEDRLRESMAGQARETTPTQTVPSKPEEGDPPAEAAPAAPPHAAGPSGAAARTHAQDLVFARTTWLQAWDFDVLGGWMRNADATACAVIAAALYGGEAAGHLLEWRVAKTAADVPRPTGMTWLVLDPPTLHVPNRVNPNLPIDSTGSHVAAGAIALPLDPMLEGVGGLLAFCRPRAGGIAFHAEEREHAAAELRRLRDRTGTIAGLQAISRVLPQIARDSTGDHLAAAYFTGAEPNARQASMRHYTQLPIATIQQEYIDTCRWIHSQLGGMAFVGQRLPVAEIGILGSMLCPSQDSVVAWVTQLQEKMGSPPRGRPSPPKIATFSDRYTIYSVQLALWGTAIRPTTKGLASLRDHAGGALVCDKGMRTRPIPLVPRVRQQLQAYAHHRDWVMRFFNLPRDTPRHFLIDEDGIATGLTPELLAAESASPFEVNAHRHALATHLRGRGWRGDRIHWLVGHASDAEDFDAPWAGMDPTLAPREIDDISNHLKCHGWAPVKGMGNG